MKVNGLGERDAESNAHFSAAFLDANSVMLLVCRLVRQS
jgi:hypothetical protein